MNTVVVVVDQRTSWGMSDMIVWLLLSPLLIAAAAAYLVFILARALWRIHRAAVAARAQRRAELLARADQQHQWVLDGDPRGTYGC